MKNRGQTYTFDVPNIYYVKSVGLTPLLFHLLA